MNKIAGMAGKKSNINDRMRLRFLKKIPPIKIPLETKIDTAHNAIFVAEIEPSVNPTKKK